MTRRWRRRWTRAGLISAAAIALVWLVSGWYGVGVEWEGTDARSAFDRRVLCWAGMIVAVNQPMRGPSPSSPSITVVGPELLHELWQPSWNWLPDFRTDRGASMIAVPLWIPLVLLGVPTGVAWWRDRRRGRRLNAGECPSCGYDRAGLAAGAACPECGVAAGG